MKILAADTSTAINTVALCEGEQVLAETVVDCKRAHAERLLATVDWVLQEAGMKLDRVEALAISAGPGSFTGLRIGVAAWKGLAFARGLPLVAVPTLDAMTRSVWMYEGTVVPMLDARMREVYGAIYRLGADVREKLAPDRVCPVESLLEALSGPVLFLGDGARLYRDRIRACLPAARFAPPWLAMPRASAVAAEAALLLAQGAPTDAALVNPVYLRQSQPEERRAHRQGTAS